MATSLPAYAELHCLSNFSFQRGASRPEELVTRAADLGYTALAMTDECSMAGVVRAHVAARERGFQLLLGSEFSVQDSQGGPEVKLIVLAHNLEGWGNLCEFITVARSKLPKGSYAVSWGSSDFSSLLHCEVLLVPPRGMDFEALCAVCLRAKSLFGERLWLALELWRALDDELWRQLLDRVSASTGVPLVAAGNVHMHTRSRKPLQDVITAVRLGKPVSECGFELHPNAEAHLRPRSALARIYPASALRATLTIAQRCDFSLDELRAHYQYPIESVLPGLTAIQTLRRYTYEGMSQRYPAGIPAKVQAQVEHELKLIAELKYEMYFLTVHDIVRFARQQNILCQGRGSAANSAVCYCLYVTEIDPERTNLLFERFISRERNEPPDIDIDFEHQRREEVIQYIYKKYGNDRAALTAVVVTYGRKSAIRDVGKALGLDDVLVDTFAKEQRWFDTDVVLVPQLAQCLEKAGVAPEDLRIYQWLELTEQLRGFPRHLSQHVGGFVLTQGKLTRLVPVEKAAMDARFVIQWEKDDLDAMGLLKVDVLALGMLSAIRRCLEFVGRRRGATFLMQDIPAKDTATYDMICAADTVGVFQIESRAQMSMLPRLKPREFYDLVVEVAIVRPGPIQGDMVHPYLKRREEKARGGNWQDHSDPRLHDALNRTLGVPIFQEQVMQLAMTAAGFTADEADNLRRSMAAWKRSGGIHKFHDRVVEGMVANNYPREFAQKIFSQIEGFGEYGFPESHAASFALLVYVSAWLKRHEPASFLAALLNAQPLGFYSPSQLVQDARRHAVEVRAVDVMHSDWDCTLESDGVDAGNTSKPASANEISVFPIAPDQPAVRLGLRLVSGLSEAVAERIVQARAGSPFVSTEDLAIRAQLDQGDLKSLAGADVLAALSGHRRQQVWEASALKPAPGLLKAVPVNEEWLELPAATEGAEVVFDYASTGLTLRSHPLALLRTRLSKMNLITAAQLRDAPSGRLVRTCGIVVTRQQPQTAKGVVFVTLEDETGSVNVIVWKSLREKQRSELLHSRLMAVYGVWQRDVESGGEVRHLVAKRLRDLTPLLGSLATQSRDFH
jgi:error-prone DNA polymerase